MLIGEFISFIAFLFSCLAIFIKPRFGFSFRKWRGLTNIVCCYIKQTFWKFLASKDDVDCIYWKFLGVFFRGELRSLLDELFIWMLWICSKCVCSVFARGERVLCKLTDVLVCFCRLTSTWPRRSVSHRCRRMRASPSGPLLFRGRPQLISHWQWRVGRIGPA